MEKVNICGYDDKGLYELSDVEVKVLEANEKEIEEYKEKLHNTPSIDEVKAKAELQEVDENKKVIIDQYKRQLDIISEVQDDLSIAFENCEINIDEYMEGMCKTNDRAMAIINQLKIESEYIPF